jgi:hypothetical protein
MKQQNNKPISNIILGPYNRFTKQQHRTQMLGIGIGRGKTKRKTRRRAGERRPIVMPGYYGPSIVFPRDVPNDDLGYAPILSSSVEKIIKPSKPSKPSKSRKSSTPSKPSTPTKRKSRRSRRG